MEYVASYTSVAVIIQLISLNSDIKSTLHQSPIIIYMTSMQMYFVGIMTQNQGPAST